MATYEELMRAARDADAAGDDAGAKRFLEIAAQQRVSQGSTAAPAAPAPSNNVLVGAANRAAGLVSSTMKGIEQAGDALQRAIPLPGYIPGKGFVSGEEFNRQGGVEQNSIAGETAQGIDQTRNEGALAYQPGTPWAEVKKNPTPANILKFGGETLVTSIPDMAAVLHSLPTYVLARVGELAEQRATNDGRTEVTPGDLAAAVATSTATAIPERFGARGITQPVGRNILARAATAAKREAGTEFAQEFTEDFGTTAGTKTGFDASRAVERGIAGAVGGGIGGGVAQPTLEAARTAARAPEALRQAQARRDYSNNPDQVASDVRVGRLYEQAKQSIDQFDSGTKPTNDVVFKKVHDSLKQKLYDGIEGLYRNGDITRDHRDELTKDADAILKQAGQHNRDLSEVDIEKIRRMSLDPRVETGLINAFRDLNTATFSGMKKNMVGPVERTVRNLPIGAAVTGGGYAAHGPLGFLAGVTAGQAVQGGVRSAARAVDRMMGRQDPEILRRYGARVDMLKGKNVNVGDTANFLDDLGANVQAGAQLGNSEDVQLNRQAASARAQLRLANQVAGGGWEGYVAEQTGLDPSQQDIVMMSLMAKGKLNAQQHRQFLKNPHVLKQGNQGNAIIDLMNAEASRMGIKPAVARPASPTSEAQPASGEPQGSGIRNPLAYAQTMRNVETATRNADETAPSPALKAAVTRVANARTKADKQAVLMALRMSYPQDIDWINTNLAPLAEFGPKENANAGPAAPSGAGGAGAPGPLNDTNRLAGPRIGPALAPDFGRGHGVVKGDDIPFVTKEVEAYREKAGIKKKPLPKGGLPMPESYLYKVADWMDQAQHAPNDPAVRKAYEALARETEAQFDNLIKAGNIKFEAWTETKGEPYRNSGEMLEDVRKNKHLWFFRTENGFGQQAADEGHPLLAETKYTDQNGKPLVVNDLFRIVHDYYGHSQNRFAFGEKGEYNAFHEHSRMFSDDAVPALAAETLAQNAWVNFGPHLRNEAGKVPGPGEPGHKPRPERPFSEQKSTIVPKALLMQDPGNDDPAAVASRVLASGKYKLDPEELANSVIPTLYEGRVPATKRSNKFAHAQALDEQWRETRGAPLTEYNEENRRKIARVVVAEALHAISKDGNAATWYRDKTEGAHAIVSLMHPEINTDPVKKTAFNYILAVTSNGMTIAQNAKLAERLYAQFKANGKMPIFGEGDRATIMKKHFGLWNDMAKEMGTEKFIEFLSTTHKVRDLKKMGFSVSKELMDEELPGSVVAGPKIGGGFFQNLMGNYDPLTMDRWFMRSWGRWTGQSVIPRNEKTFTKRLDRFRNALTPEIVSDWGHEGDPSKMSEEELLDLAKTIYSRDAQEGFLKDDTTRERPEERVAAQRLYLGSQAILEAPMNGKQRRFMRETIREALETLRGMGITIGAADLQALVWYPEKDFYAHNGIGTSKTAPTDYEAEFWKLAKARGKTDEEIEAAVQARTGRRGQSPRRVDAVLDAEEDAGDREEDGLLHEEADEDEIPF
jgi:hypothetical protein